MNWRRSKGQAELARSFAASTRSWDEPLLSPSVPVFHLEGFDGPLDLLVQLAERQRLDLGRLSFMDLVEQFDAALHRLSDRVPLERRAQWLVLTSHGGRGSAPIEFPGRRS